MGRIGIKLIMYNHLTVVFVLVLFLVADTRSAWKTVLGENRLLNSSNLEMFVDQVPDMPRIKAYHVVDGVPLPKSFKITMFQKYWKFHRDLRPSKVFAYGEFKHKATVPGPTIEALHGVSTHIRWQNRLPPNNIFPWDPTIPTAIPRTKKGTPTVVHVHGGINEPESDGHSHSWFTNQYSERGPAWTKKTYHYHNKQQPGNSYYHDHTMGLTRENLLAGLFGSYIIRQPDIEDSLGLPHGDEFDRPLFVFDRSFCTDGSIYMNSTGNNPEIHPQWQPQYSGDFIVVNGKAWPYMNVKRRKYRFRIINVSNARFFRFSFSNGLRFIHIGSDSTYNEWSVLVKKLLLGPSEIADVIVDFSKSISNSVILLNDAAFPYPFGKPVNERSGKVMKFIISQRREFDSSKVPRYLIKYPTPKLCEVSQTRYIIMHEYEKKGTYEATHFYLNGRSYNDPVTELPKVGSTEIWNVINLTWENHPFHIHLALFKVLDQVELEDQDELEDCLKKINDAEKCDVHKHVRGKRLRVVPYEQGWKNVYKIRPGYMTRILVKFAFVHTNESFPFDATAEPGYVYHCHMLEHEDNVMMRPFKLVE